jgi:hypothetical protein
MITLLDVGARCARMRAANLDLFELLGAWVLDTPAGAPQQRWATACHRHAWHAELWAQRAPTIRSFDLDAAVAAARGALGTPSSPEVRAEWYASVLATLIAELDEHATQVDALLDPSTARTAALVRGDLAELAMIAG